MINYNFIFFGLLSIFYVLVNNTKQTVIVKEPVYIKHPVKQIHYGMPININTQRVGEYQSIGYLYTNEDKKRNNVLPLFGRRVHNGSSNWNYMTSTHKSNIRIPLVVSGKDCSKEYGCKELYEDEEVYIEEFGKVFNVKLYDRTIKYIPY